MKLTNTQQNLALLLADPIKRVVFNLLLTKQMTANSIATEMGISQRAATQHINVLKSAGLVRGERQGRYQIYSVDRSSFEALAHLSMVLFDQIPQQQGSSAFMKEDIELDQTDELIKKWNMPWTKDDQMSVGILLRFNLLTRTVNQLASKAAARFKLKHVELQLLAILDQIGPSYDATLTEIAKQMFLSLSGLAKQVAHAEKMGLIERLPNPQDARSEFLRLTADGRKTLHKVLESLRTHELAPLFKLPTEDRLLLSKMSRDSLRKLRKTHH